MILQESANNLGNGSIERADLDRSESERTNLDRTSFARSNFPSHGAANHSAANHSAANHNAAKHNAAAEMSGHENSAAPIAGSEELPVVWRKVQDLLKDSIDRQIYSAWIRPLSIAALEFSTSKLALNEGAAAGSSLRRPHSCEITLLAPNKFCCEHVAKHYGEIICSAVNVVLNTTDSQLRFKVSAAGSIPAAERALPVGTVIERMAIIDRRPVKQRTEQQPRQMSAGAQKPASDNTNLNPKYNFSNFVVGTCNQFAHAASIKVADSLGSTYNPLFIYGGVGLGKTHLANAIGNASRRRNKKVLLVSSESFVSQLITALKTNSMDRFKSRFRSLDLLIIDDIQFIIGKERTQEEFFHTFNDLYNGQKQIIITSDKIPQELIGLEDRLRTRFACGLSCDLQAPDFETRVAIVKNKSESCGIDIPDAVARLLAERIDTNVRELEGALNRLHALCSFNESQATLDIAEEVLRSIAPGRTREITTELIQKTVATKFNVSLHDIVGKRRTQNIALARQVAMYLCRQLTACSYPELGALFGGRDHSTVIHANKVISERINSNEAFRKDIASLEKEICY